MTTRARRYYAVASGRRPGIYTEWAGPTGAQVQVTGFPGAVFKGFASLSEAERFLASDRTGIRPPASAGRRKPREVLPLRNGLIHIYTDGGCLRNPGPGGWAAVILDGDTRTEISGGYRLTTNNRMELQACIQALKTLGTGTEAVLFTDSQYVVNAVEKGWARRWRSQRWMRDRTHKAENADLWTELLGLIDDREVTFRWVRGHAGNPENERCDELAGRAALGRDLAVDGPYENAQKERDRP